MSFRILWILFALICLAFPGSVQNAELGVVVNTEQAYAGYTFVAPQINSLAYVIDNEGRVIRQWDFGSRTREVHLLENGNLLVVRSARDIMDYTLMPRGFPPDGGFAEFTWDGELISEFAFTDAERHHHHGVDILPNGNIIAVVRQYYHIDEAIAMGLNPAIVAEHFDGIEYFLPDTIVEIDLAQGEVLWIWNPMDHLIQALDPALPNYGAVSEHPQRIDINYQSYYLKGITSTQSAGAGNWMHANMVNYNPMLDQVVMSVRSFDEFWVIDHSETTEEASGPAGDLLYRWGNPFAHGAGSLSEDRQLFQQHDVQWIDQGLPGAGNFLIFNNRNNLTREDETGSDEYSSIIELSPHVRADGRYDWTGEPEIVWQYAEDFFSPFISGVQRLPNGNTLITEGRSGRLIEVSAAGEVVWEFINPMTSEGFAGADDEVERGLGINNAIFRARKYSPDHPGLVGKDLRPGKFIGE